MNPYQTNLFNDLVALVSDGDTFFKQEFILHGHRYWVFNYRLSSYTEFLRPSALECRGHMFEVDADGKAIRLAALPMPKFFNLGENPMTMDLDLSEVDVIQDKRDGSLISTYMHDGKVLLKTKGSLSSDQAIAAMNWLALPEQAEFKAELLWITDSFNCTVNLEWTAPDNRIVLGYLKPSLTILNVRDRATGDFVTVTEDSKLHKYLVDEYTVDNPVEFINSIPAMTDDIEGFVVKLKSGLWFKVKTDKYCSLHHTKDSINNPRRLFEAVLDEAADDLLSMFSTDELAVKQITAMQERVAVLYNTTVKYVEQFYADNKHLDRKEYAIKGTAEAGPKLVFGLVMNLYLEKPNDYKGFFKSKYKEFGFKDEKVIVE